MHFTVLQTACEQDQDGMQFYPDPARKLSAKLYDIYHSCVYSEKLLMMDRGNVRNTYNFIPKNKFEKLMHLVGFIIGIYHDSRSHERQALLLFSEAWSHVIW
jgi:hypothetical protein